MIYDTIKFNTKKYKQNKTCSKVLKKKKQIKEKNKIDDPIYLRDLLSYKKVNKPTQIDQIDENLKINTLKLIKST